MIVIKMSLLMYDHYLQVKYIRIKHFPAIDIFVPKSTNIL